MEDKYYHQTPVLFPFGGMIGILLLFVVHSIIYKTNQRLFWLIVSSLILATCLWVGLLVKKLYRATIKDQLTGLFNRNYFYEMLAYEIKRAKRYSTDLSFVMIDIDDFKTVNDTRGHLEGDKVLIALSKIFKRYVRSSDILCRWGGEEFAVILPETDTDGAYILFERIRKAVESTNWGYKVTISAGISTIRDEMDTDKFIGLADQALYKAKERKNSVMTAFRY